MSSLNNDKNLKKSKSGTKKKFVLPPGCTANHSNNDPHIQYRFPVLGRAVTMELPIQIEIYIYYSISKMEIIFLIYRVIKIKNFPSAY